MENLSVCRICLNKDVHHAVKDLQLQETYEILTRLPFQSDMRPLAVCYICYAQLRASHRFKLKCLRAEQLLAQMLDQRPAGDEVHGPTQNNQSLNELSFSAIEKTIIIGSDLEDVDKVTLEIMYRNDEGLEEQNTEAARIAMKSELKSNLDVKAEANKPKRDDDIKNSILKNITDINKMNSPYVNVKHDVYQQTNVNSNSNDDRKPKLRKRFFSAKKSFMCDECKKSFNRKCHLIIHIRKYHVENKIFVCDVCPKSFSHKSHLDIHARKHLGAKQYVCNENQLKSHTRTHIGEKPYVCNTCGFGFANKSTLGRHLLRHEEHTSFTCNICKKGFTSQFDLNRHAFTHTTERAYICHVCGKSFTVRSYLTRHVLIHLDERPRPYVCSVCNKRFTTNTNLEIHSRMHTGVRPYVCKVCERAFVQSCALLKHSRIHTGEKPYVCDVCGKGFRQLHHLKVHSSSHTGERPYACDTCGKGFTTKGNLTVHLRLHSADKSQ